MIQLNPPIPLVTDDGRKCTALMVLDYGPEYQSLMLVGMDDSRELWWIPHTRLRMDTNISLGRMPSPKSTPVPASTLNGSAPYPAPAYSGTNGVGAGHS